MNPIAVILLTFLANGSLGFSVASTPNNGIMGILSPDPVRYHTEFGTFIQIEMSQCTTGTETQPCTMRAGTSYEIATSFKVGELNIAELFKYLTINATI
jgi:hypothetical protein